jgi:hypothetical protein
MPVFKTIMLLMMAAALLAFSPASEGGSAVAEVHPVLVDNCLIGGTIDGKWAEASAIAPQLKGGEKYRFYTLAAGSGESTGGSPKVLADYCSETLEVELDPKPTEGVALVVGGDWNAMPRAPRMLGNNEQAYIEATADILRRKRFRKPRINITRVIRIDLDGDGVQEVLVSAAHYEGGLGSATGSMAIRAKAGDYSLVFLRKLIRGKVENIIIDGEFYPTKADEGGPPSQYIVTAVGDVNGDGTMEVVVRSDYYEGDASTVYSIRDNKATALSSCACGA